MIKLDKVAFHYKQMPMYFDLHIKMGERVAMVGASGAGKSTLLNLIAGFEYADSGEIWLNGKNHSKNPPHLRPVSMLFQENNLFMHLTVQQNEQVKQVADAVGLGEFLTRLPTQLSGGQKQRVALARCLLRDQPILLLDEPFSALDPSLRQEMLQLLQQLCVQKNLTVLLVTHQPDELQGYVDRILTVENGRIVQDCAGQD